MARLMSSPPRSSEGICRPVETFGGDDWRLRIRLHKMTEFPPR
jgi:hypothetical protein